ncbi:MAG: hypothetical protein WAW86_05935 [Gammaproteobacteria bacterium]
MKIFSGVKQTNFKKYNSILFLESISDITESDSAALIKLIDEAADPATKVRLSEKLAKCIGVPGLIYYVDTSLSLLEKEQAAGMPIQQSGLNALSYLMLAQILYHHDPDAKNLMNTFMPEEHIEEINYWDIKKNKLIKLADLVSLEEEASLMGQQLFSVFFLDEHNEMSHSR